MARSRKFLTAGAVGVAALALIGAGASATFTDAVHATQSITAGTLNMTVTGPAGSSTNGKTVTLEAFGPTNSTFTTGAQKVITTNSGDIAASALRLSASDSNNNAALKAQVYVRIDSWVGPNESGGKVMVYNGTLANLELNPMNIVGPIPAGSTDPFEVTYYAGPGATSLTNAAQGGLLIPSITVEYEG